MSTAIQLIKKIKNYQTDFDEDAIIRAYQLSIKAHSLQTRSSGEPYFSHPLAVAEILIDLKLDSTSVITALLHDVVEDTLITLDLIEQEFGEEIAKLVDGVTKLSKIETMATGQKVAENFRKLVMAMSQDLRVLLVKLADRLHNMRTIEFIKSEEKRKRIATESLEIYAPLAARIGMYKIRDELQDLSFAQINTDARKYIIEKLNELKQSKQDIIDKIIEDLRTKISQENIGFEVYGREKKPFSIWKKMKSKNVGFAYLHDIMAFRILVTNTADCYRVLGVINCNYNMIPGSFKDYISTPKENGYRSLHLVILGPQNKKIEIQIRSKEMHQNAEFGVAAHWSYKENAKINIENQQYKWIRELINLFDHIGDASEVLRNHKISIHEDQVFCFSPNGDVFNLPVGATMLDFAYFIHSEVGNCCVGGKINGIIVPLRQKLENGDQVEISTEKNAKPSFSWLQFVTTSKARAAIKHFIRNEKYLEYSLLGKVILQKFFTSRKLEINEELLTKVLPNFNKKTLNDIYVFVAEGLITRNDVLKAIYPNYQDSNHKNNNKKENDILETSNSTNHNNSFCIKGLPPTISIKLSDCCHPIPSDKIVGLISVGNFVAIHNTDCQFLQKIAVISGKLLDVCWDKTEDKVLYPSKIMVLANNSPRSLAEISSFVAKNKTNLTNIKINKRSNDLFEIIIDLEVKNNQHLQQIISYLKASGKVIEVSKI